jgi:hypothetical protein
MHDLLHTLLEIHDRDIGALGKAGDGWEFITYLDYWLSALFVVVEGFNKLKIRDSRVQQLFKPNINSLKQLRHETYHFVVKKGASAESVISQLNWAEDLHNAIRNHIREYVKGGAVKEQVKAFLEWRVKRSAPSAPQSRRPRSRK